MKAIRSVFMKDGGRVYLCIIDECGDKHDVLIDISDARTLHDKLGEILRDAD